MLSRMAAHPFEERPHRELMRLAFPVFLSLVAEPLTGLVDTAFVGTLGSSALAALGVAALVMSGLFWMFNFLGIGTQTEVARALGEERRDHARDTLGTALALAVVLGVGLVVFVGPLLGPIAAVMGAEGATREGAVTYLRIRILGAPAVLTTVACLGALRGLQDMRTAMRIAILVNLLNLGLDPLLIFGLGPVPAFGLAGAAAASTVSQYVGAALAIAAVRRSLGASRNWNLERMRSLLVVGRDLFLRTGSLMLFLVLATREATRLGDASGAAHQAVRQVWITTAFMLDAYAAAAQSLVGYFVGSNRMQTARRVARVACTQGLVTGFLIGAAMLGATSWAVQLVSATAAIPFYPAWKLAALAQPINAISFVTDGVHWATSDYRYLRNVMMLATGSVGAVLVGLGAMGKLSLTGVWALLAVWITIRALFGALRLWPGIGAAPLGMRES